MSLVKDFVKIGAWAEVQVNDGMGAELRKTLTLFCGEDKTPLAQYRLHPTDPNKLYIPRAFAAKSNLEVEGDWEKLGCTSKMIPGSREGQIETINSYLSALKEGRGRYGGIIQAVTGAGKTVMALDIVCKLNMKTLIIVPRTSLVDQWRQQIIKWTNCKAEDIGLVQSSSCEVEGKKFVIAMIHSLAQKYKDYAKMYPQIFYEFGTVVFDECHVVGAETFSQTAAMFKSKYRIGLSATPRRKDGMDRVFWWHIGPVLAKFTTLQAKARVRILPYHGQDTNHGGCIWGGNLNLGRYLNRVARSPERQRLVLRVVQALAERDHDILVLSDRILHLKTLRADLIAGGIDAKSIGMLIGNEKQPDRKIILGTYGSASMGVDIPRLTALVLATPRADIEQAVGRVLRQGSPVVVDIVDTSSHIMRGWAGARKKYFRRITDNIQDRAMSA